MPGNCVKIVLEFWFGAVGFLVNGAQRARGIDLNGRTAERETQHSFGDCPAAEGFATQWADCGKQRRVLGRGLAKSTMSKSRMSPFPPHLLAPVSTLRALGDRVRIVVGKILVSEKRARLKPCRRCGYSLAHIAGARNCPECGLAVRISLSSNSGLEWSSPVWQRFMAVAFGVLGLGLLCRTVGSAAYCLFRLMIQKRSQFGGSFEVVWWLFANAAQASAIICGIALCLMARGERRYPDASRGVRLILFWTGVAVFSLGLLGVEAWNRWLPSTPTWVSTCAEFMLTRPLIPPVIAVLVCSCAADLGKRGQSRLLSKLSQVPLYPAAAGVVFWLMRVDQFFWPLRSIVCDWLFPLSMTAMLGVTARVLLRGAREADENWISD
jgi:hypothetical protein